MKTYDIWLEGYSVTGSEAKAKFLGSVEAESFRDAILKFHENTSRAIGHFDQDRLTYFGCNHFETEAEARARFG